MSERAALISFKTTSSRKLDVFREALRRLSEAVTWEKISSVYRVNRRAESFSSLRRLTGEELLNGFAVVGLARTAMVPAQIMELLHKIEDDLRHEKLRRSLSMNLLAYEEEVLRFPELTLPHPEFHLHPEELIPACEIWPDYVHPVLNQRIADLAQRWVEADWGEYHCAGRTLLDF